MKLDAFLHIVQSREWGDFKSSMNTKSVIVDDIQFTKHKLPKLPFYIAYAPKINFLKQKFDWEKLKNIAIKEKCIMVRFDVPNNINENNDEVIALVKDLNNKCKISPRSTFSKHNILLDISGSLDEILTGMNQKTRYNIKLAEKKGVKVLLKNDYEGINIFNKLMKETSARQGFLPHSENYYAKCFDNLYKNKMANILVAYYKNEPLGAWMLFNKDNVLYYPYGTSSAEHRNLMSSNLLAWEAIKLGKDLGCDIFDMWGAAADENDKAWWGFTKFKLGYGGKLVEYIDSFDLVINKPIYNIFNFSYWLFWKLRKLNS
jgi:lipid II:glycine glycyltransferase (peptidoglycan interpeptide bridge formation enzyme)